MPKAFLRVMRGKHAGKSVPLLSGRFVIGREEGCDLRPSSDKISRRHCAFTVTEEDVTLADLGSTNGTLVNDVPIEETVWLQHGDVVTAGTLQFEVVIGEEPIGDGGSASAFTPESDNAMTETDREFHMPERDNRYTVNLDDLAELPESIDESPTSAPTTTPPPATPIPGTGGTAWPPPGTPPPPAAPPVPAPHYPTPLPGQPGTEPPPMPPAYESPATPPPPGASAPGVPPAYPPTPHPPMPPTSGEARPPGVTAPPVKLPDPSTVGIRQKQPDDGRKRPLPPPPSGEINPSEQAADLLKKYAEAGQNRPKDE